MRGVRQKGSWTWFSVKVSVVLMALAAAGLAFASRYRLGWDVQQDTSLPYHLFLIDRKDQRMQRGACYAFSAQGLAPLYPDGTKMVKRLVGLPGDRVRIDSRHRIVVNGVPVGSGLPLAKRFHAAARHFQGQAVLPPGHYWFLGQHPRSLDSRYFGAVRASQIIGRAYGLV